MYNILLLTYFNLINYYLLFIDSYVEKIQKVPDPVGASFHPGGHYGLLSEKMDSTINKYFDIK